MIGKCLRYIGIPVFLCIALFSCKQQEMIPFQEVFQEHNDICIVVGIKEMIDFSSGCTQTQFNPSTHVFRSSLGKIQEDLSDGSMVEIVQEYFVVKLDCNPLAVGDEVHGEVILNSDELDRNYTNVNFTVVKTSDKLVWLWDDTIKLGVVIRSCGKQ